MDLYVLRHGKAEERASTVKSDSKRALTETGTKDIQCISKSIRSMAVKFDYVISSPLLRAKQTAEIAFSYVKSKKRSIVFWNELKPESNPERIFKKLSALKPNSVVLLVGHEPVLSELISMIISPGNHDVSISIRKGGFAHLQCFPRDSVMVGTLRSIMTSKQLKSMRG